TGGGSLAELGTGTLVLSPSLQNNYSGGTVLASGTLILGSTSTPLGSGALTLVAGSGASLQTTVGAGLTLANPVVLDAVPTGLGLTVGGSGTLTFTGATTLNGQVGLQVNALTTFAGPIGGTGGLTVSGTGTLVLSGGGNYTGATMLTGGSLAVNGSQPTSAVG